jgi:hypothetical protein
MWLSLACVILRDVGLDVRREANHPDPGRPLCRLAFFANTGALGRAVTPVPGRGYCIATKLRLIATTTSLPKSNDFTYSIRKAQTVNNHLFTIAPPAIGTVLMAMVGLTARWIGNRKTQFRHGRREPP